MPRVHMHLWLNEPGGRLLRVSLKPSRGENCFADDFPPNHQPIAPRFLCGNCTIAHFATDFWRSFLYFRVNQLNRLSGDFFLLFRSIAIEWHLTSFPFFPGPAIIEWHFPPSFRGRRWAKKRFYWAKFFLISCPDPPSVISLNVSPNLILPSQ